MIPYNLITQSILNKVELSSSDIEHLLSTQDEYNQKIIRDHAYQKKCKVLGKIVHYRGLLESSNRCEKDCFYCGIRASNAKVERYDLTLEEVLSAAKYAWESGYGSIVIQTGEKTSSSFVKKIEDFLKAIKKMTNQELSITLSCGEQSSEIFERWYHAGATRYLLRIETSNPKLYQHIHPHNAKHSFEKRVQALYSLKQIGFQVGTGVMIGLPHQTIADLTQDLLFFKHLDIDMVGMGPYIEHSLTPLYLQRDVLLPLTTRYQLSLLMIATLRIIMNDINIAAATALQSIKWNGREDAILSGANIIMPNITPLTYRSKYLLYENKPCTDEQPEMCKNCLEARIQKIGETIGYHQAGDSRHALKKQK